MYKNYLLLACSLLIISCSVQDQEIVYPESKKIEFRENLHGYEISDSYRWLEDFTSDESIEWIQRQNKFTKRYITVSYTHLTLPTTYSV